MKLGVWIYVAHVFHSIKKNINPNLILEKCDYNLIYISVNPSFIWRLYWLKSDLSLELGFLFVKL